MKYFILLTLFFLIPVMCFSQRNSLYLGINPSINHNFGFSVGGAHATGDTGFFIEMATDLQMRTSLEEGLSGDAAVSLRETDRVESWLSLSGGAIQQYSDKIGFKLGVGISTFNIYTEHDGRYWVFRERSLKPNVIVGAVMSVNQDVDLGLSGSSTPLSIGITIGFRIRTPNNE